MAKKELTKTFVASGKYRKDLTEELGEYSKYGPTFSKWFSIYEGPAHLMLVVNGDYCFMPGHIISLGQGCFEYEKDKMASDLFNFVHYECHR